MVARATHTSLEDAELGEPEGANGGVPPAHLRPFEERHVQLADVITSFRRHWRAAVAAVLLVSVGLGLFLFLRDQARPRERWEASVEILVPARDEEGNLPEGVPPTLLQGQSAVALSAKVTNDALRRAGLEAEADDITFDYGTSERGDIIRLTVTAPTEEDAAALANGYVSAYMASRRRTVAEGSQAESLATQANLGTLQQRLAQVEAELEQIDPDLLASLPDTAGALDEGTGEDTGGGTDEETSVEPNVELPASTPLATTLLVYERQDLIGRIEAGRRNFAESNTTALVPHAFATLAERVEPEDVTPEPPTPLIPIAVALGLAVLAALGVPVLLDHIDHSIRDSQTAGAALAAPVLSTIPAPASSQVATLVRPGTPGGNAYRSLATASVATDQLPRALVVTAPVGQMQDTVAANFAAALSDLGLRVVLVPTHPRQAWYADAPEGAPTLPDFLNLAYSGRLNGEVPGQLQRTPLDNLRILPHGRTEPDALIDGLPPLLRSFADSGVDVTVIAAPSMLEDPSATILVWSTRSVLWVVEAGEVTQQQANDAATKLELAGASPFGIAVVDGKG
jgi:Mrp family chromosome partitioning ATPase